MAFNLFVRKPKTLEEYIYINCVDVYKSKRNKQKRRKIVTMARLCTPVLSRGILKLLWFCFSSSSFVSNLDVICWIEKSRGPFHSHTLIVLLMAFLIARVTCIDTGIFFSHTTGRASGRNGRWRWYWARFNYLFQYLSDVSEEIWNAFIAWEKKTKPSNTQNRSVSWL